MRTQSSEAAGPAGSTERDRVDVAVVGGGIVGLATAWKLIQRAPGSDIVVIEKEANVGNHQTGRNSGVLHSGIYYAPGSAKARMCRSGQREMIDFCVEHGIRHEMIGKVIVATSPDEFERLDALGRRADANGIEIEHLGRNGLHEIEPNAAGLRAIHVPGAGITDYRAVCAKLVELLTAGGVDIRLGQHVRSVVSDDDGASVLVDDADGRPMAISARKVVTCAGLHGDRLARSVDPTMTDRIMPFRGEYFELTPARSTLVNGLIYPVPDPAFPFLGVHLTKMIDGAVHAGPNAVPALAREGYRWRDIDARDAAEIISNPGAWRLARKHWRTGVGEIARSASKRRFLAALQRLVPAIEIDDLVRSPAGVRAQALRRDGALLDDFVWHERDNVVSVVNAPSPAATASLRIASEIADRVLTGGTPTDLTGRR